MNAEQNVGDIGVGPSLGDPPDEALARETPLYVAVMRRLKAEGRWFGQIEAERDEMMRLSRERFPNKSDRQQWVYGELDRMYPPKSVADIGSTEPITSQGEAAEQLGVSQDLVKPDDGSIQGLSDVPSAWPELPANASLAAEIGWVQANRLRIVEERPGRATLVRLERAASPAPSWAALGWLETSIRSYAKYVDVASRAMSSDEGEAAAVVRRERMAIEDVHALLQEMQLEPKTCPHCGKQL